MIYIRLFFEFFKIGLFTFGGAYGAIPLIRESVVSLGWLTSEELLDLLAISESTPGPIMVNTATMVGYNQAGIAGSFFATFGVVLPSFIIIMMVPAIAKIIGKRQFLKTAMEGIKPCISAVICATGIHLALELTVLKAVHGIDYLSIAMLALIVTIVVLYKKLVKKDISPILLIIISAMIGIIAFK